MIRAVPVCGRPALVLVSQARGGPSGAGAFVTVGPQEDARVRGPVVPGPVNRWDQQVLRAGFGAAGGCGHVRVRLRLRAPPFQLPRARLLSPCLLSLCLLSPCLLSPCLLTCGLLSCGLLGPRLPSSGLLSCGPLGPRWLCPRLPRGRLLRCRTLAAAAAFPPAGPAWFSAPVPAPPGALVTGVSRAIGRVTGVRHIGGANLATGASGRLPLALVARPVMRCAALPGLPTGGNGGAGLHIPCPAGLWFLLGGLGGRRDARARLLQEGIRRVTGPGHLARRHLGRIGPVERPDALVPVEQGCEQLCFPGIHAEHDARAPPRLLDRVADVTGNRWHGLCRQAMHDSPALPRALQRCRRLLRPGNHFRITHLRSSPEQRRRTPRTLRTHVALPTSGHAPQRLPSSVAGGQAAECVRTCQRALAA